jgi:hypothetical protein
MTEGSTHMGTVERRPLPPSNSRVTPITEADRAEIIGGARDVIDHYLNGPGSYWDSGPRKPLEETVKDLERFKNQVIASKQFADDPNSIMDSVIDLIDRTTEQVEQAARDNEGRDNITRPYPHTDDPIDDPRVTSPRALSNAALPISLPVETEQTEPPASSKPVRILSRRIVGQSPASAFSVSAPAVADRQNPYSHRFGSWTSFPQGTGARNPNLPVSPPLAPAVDPNYSGGIPGRLAMLAVIDPQNSNQPAAPMDDEDQADMRALDARLSSSGNIRDAVALYNARRSSRRQRR